MTVGTSSTNQPDRGQRAGAFAAVALAILFGASAVAAQPRRPPWVPPKREEVKVLVQHIKQRAKERRDRRQDRRKEQREKLRAHLKEVLRDHPITAAIRAELEVHARRVARLSRLRELAAEADNGPAVEKIDQLLLRENARHEGWLAKVDAHADGGVP